jgi:hypothetical protein
VFEEELALECRIGGVVFRPARGNRFAIPGYGEWIAGKEHEEILVAQRRHDGSCMEFQAYSDGWSMQARAEGLDPGVKLFRALCEAQKLTVCSARGLAADSVCRLSPVEANKGRQCFGGLWLHVGAPCVWYRSAEGHAGVRSAKALERAGSAADSADALTNASAPADAKICA